MTPPRPSYTVRLKGGRELQGQVQGSGGPVESDRRLRLVIAGRLKVLERADRQREHIRKGGAMWWTGPGPLEHAGKMLVWTDPDNETPGDRFTAFSAGEIENITDIAGEQVWPEKEEDDDPTAS